MISVNSGFSASKSLVLEALKNFFKLFLSKLLTLFVSVYLVASAAFFLLRLLPGSPFTSDRHLSPEILASLEAKYNLDKPLLEQYFQYIAGLFLHFDFGPSLKYPNREVLDILVDAFPVSLGLGFAAFIVALVLGISGGIFLAAFEKRLVRINAFSQIAFSVISFYSNSAIAMPSFISAGLLIAIFGLYLNWLPVALWEGPEYIILPVLTLAVSPTAYIMRITRASFKEVLEQNYIKIAIAKGLGYAAILYKHALKNTLLPLLAYIGPLLAILITGSFVVEFIFALPGMGKYFVTAFINRDYFLVTGVVIIFSTILSATNIAIELINPLVNPKLKT